MQSIFTVSTFEFPYLYKFPGQASDEVTLFITRESEVVLWVRKAQILVSALVTLLSGLFLSNLLGGMQLEGVASAVRLLALVISVLFMVVGWWWVNAMWEKSICVLTTKRLAKFIYTTPFNRHSLSLPLDMIVDTGAYSKGFVQALFKLGTFTARSAAASSGIATDEEETGKGKRINKKYFYIENVAHAEDFQHYVNKVLYAFRQHHDHLTTFRPFIPNLKGDARKRFMQKFPEYWS